MLNAIPASAIWIGEEGETFVWRVRRSDEYPELTFVVNACPIEIAAEQDGTVFFGYGGLSSSDAVAVEWDTELKDGMCVRPGK